MRPFAVLMFLPTIASAEVVTNGSFETGYSGWTLAKDATSGTFATATTLRADQFGDVGSTFFDYVDHMSVTNYSSGLPKTGTPTDGKWQALLLQNGPSTTRISQVVDMPARPQLTFDLAYHNWEGTFSPAQAFSVQLRDVDSDAVLANVFATWPGSPRSVEMTSQTIDLAAFANMTVRLQFQVVAQSTYFDVELDNVSIQPVPGGPHSDDYCRSCGAFADEMASAEVRKVDEYAMAVGGCSTGGGASPLAALAACALALFRRRR